MKVLLINPWDAEVFPPPSVGYLQAALRAAGVDVTAMDLAEAQIETGEEYDIIALTFHSFSAKYARWFRKHFAGKHLICGGHHASALPGQMLAIGYDQVVIGEGERAIVDIVVRGNRDETINGSISDIDELSFPDYDGLGYSGAMGLPVISSRGCPFACNFCSSSHFWNRTYRLRSVDNVLAEIERNVRQGVTSWMFEDDNFTLKRERAIDICRGIAEMGRYDWQCASRAETLRDDELCSALSLAGCRVVWLGIESLSQDSLDRCNKTTKVEYVLQGIANAERYGIQTMNQFIIGIPGDTINDINCTVDAIRRHRIRRRGCNTLWVLPHTIAYDKMKAAGQFDDEIYLTSGAPYYTLEQTMNTLNLWTRLINAA